MAKQNGVAAPAKTAEVSLDADLLGSLHARLGVPMARISPDGRGKGEEDDAADPDKEDADGEDAGEAGTEDAEADGAEAGAGSAEGDGDGSGDEGAGDEAGNENEEATEAGTEAPDKFTTRVEKALVDLHLPETDRAVILKIVKPFQHAFDTRVDELTREHRETSEKLQTIETERTQLLSQVNDLRGQLQNVTEAPQARAMGVDPLLLVDNPAKLNEHAEQLARAEAWLLENWDGYEGKDEKTDPSMTAPEVRKRYAEVRRLKEHVLPQAQAILQQRGQWNKIAFEAYPELKDRNSQEYQMAQQFLRARPDLKAIPSIMMMLGDMLAGEKLRKEKFKNAGKTMPKKAPNVPAAPAPSRKTTVTQPQRKPAPGIDVNKVAKDGGSRSALVTAILGSSMVN